MAKWVTKTKGAKPEERNHSARSAAYIGLGRKNQKLRTLDALVAVAADLMRGGQTITVTKVADAARVSRTTAYRYFPTSEVLSAQATLAAANAVEARDLAKLTEGLHSPEEKLDAIIAGSHAMTAAHEAAFRSLVRFTVEGPTAIDSRGLAHRPTFRRMWIEGALSPLKKDLGPQRFNRLTGALCLLCGIEPVIVLSDICQMVPDEAREVKRWVGQQLLRAAIAEAAESRASRAKSTKKR
jgi:AcrR family transcriptional regulator